MIQTAIVKQKQQQSTLDAAKAKIRQNGLDISIKSDPKQTNDGFNKQLVEIDKINATAQQNQWSQDLNTNQIVQLFHMGQEKDANLTIDIKTPGVAQHQGNPRGNNLFSKYGIYITQGDNRASTPLDFTATFTNLKNTYYGPKDDR